MERFKQLKLSFQQPEGVTSGPDVKQAPEKDKIRNLPAGSLVRVHRRNGSTLLGYTQSPVSIKSNQKTPYWTLLGECSVKSAHSQKAIKFNNGTVIEVVVWARKSKKK